MVSEPVEVEVLDRDGRPATPAKIRKKRSLAHPVNALIFVAALGTAFAILLLAIGHLLEARTRKLFDREDEPE